MKPVHRKRARRIISSGGLIIGVALLASAIGKSPVEKIGPILFVTTRDGNNEIYAMDTNGENLRRLTSQLARHARPRWSPNGKKILFHANREHGYQIYTMNPDGSNVINISGLSTIHNGGADWSPDGKKIVFASSRDGNNEIYTMNTDGSNQIRITNHPARDAWPTWSPDGKKIAFISTRSGLQKVYTMNPDGTDIFTVTTGEATGTEAPAWSPDGKKIAFASSDPGFNGINIINKDGTERVTLTNRINAGYLPDREPCWSSNGKEIIYASYVGDGVFDIFKISTDGSSKTNLTHSSPPVENITPDWGRRPFILTPRLFR